MQNCRSPFPAVLGLLILALPAAGQVAWTGGGGDANVSTANNWNPFGAPASGGTADLTFGSTGITAVNFDSAYSVKSLTFSGTTAYSFNGTGGGTTLTVGSGGIASTAAVGVFFNNTIQLATAATFSTGTSNLTFNAIDKNGSGLTLSSNGGAVTVLGNITGSGGLVVTAASPPPDAVSPRVTFLTGTGNTYTGGTTINADATLQIGSVGGTSPGSLPGDVINNGTLNFKPSNTGFSYGGLISGTGRLQMIGTNTLTLTNSNTYGGTTLVGSGTLVIGTADALPTSTSVSIGSGAVLDVAENQKIQSFGGTNSLSVIKIESGKALNVTLGAALGGTVFFGTIADGTVPGGKLIIGPSTDTTPHAVGLRGDNTNTGGTEIQSGGALLICGNGTTGSIQGNVSNDGTLIFHRGNDLTFNGVISGTGSVSQGVLSGGTTGKTHLTAANLYAGTTYVYNGGLFVSNTTGSATGTGPVIVSAINTGLGATFGGSGRITGSLTVNAFGKVVPEGDLRVGATILNGGSTFTWLLLNAAGAAGTGYGLLDISGGLTLNATATSGQYLTIAPFTFDGSNQALATNFDTTLSYSFTLATSSGITGFNPAAIVLDLSGFLNPYTGTWAVASSGSNLILNYAGGAPIPEPATSALLFGLAVGGLAQWRRRILGRKRAE